MAKGRETVTPQTEFVIAHNAVMSWFEGQTVTAAHFPDGTDFDRLLDLGAIYYKDSHDARGILAKFDEKSIAPNSTKVLEPVPLPLPPVIDAGAAVSIPPPPARTTRMPSAPATQVTQPAASLPPEPTSPASS